MSFRLDPEPVCDQVLKAVGHSAPPTDLRAICSLWPDLEVNEEDLDREGYLVPLGVHGAEILIRREDAFVRKKFTLAHELGHWAQAHLHAGQLVFGKASGPIASFRTHHKRQTLEEVWCNKFAACLLMPKSDICDYLQASAESNVADRISKGHTVFQVSEEAFLNRVTDITSISVFEIVSGDSGARVRRMFLSRQQKDKRVEEAINDLLHLFRGSDSPRNGLIPIDEYTVQAKLKRHSGYGGSWLVSIDPS